MWIRKTGLCLFAGLVFACGGSDRPAPSDSPPADAVERPSRQAERSPASGHPLSIPAIRERQFSAFPVETIRFVADRGAYGSYIVSYRSEGLEQFALMNVPSGERPVRGFPVVVVCHGYIPPSEFSTLDSYKNTSAAYAANGFLVLKPDYRGHGDSEGTAGGIWASAAYTIDVLQLIASLATVTAGGGETALADTDRVYVVGHSLGGEVALRVLETTRAVKAASIWAAAAAPFPENTLHFVRRSNPELAGSIRRELNSLFDEEDYSRFSPIDNVHLISAPVLLHHGTADESVPYEWSENLSQAMTAAGVTHRLYAYPGDDHNLARGGFYRAVERDTFSFRNLP